jgi:tRNA-2-methylthio-N6-dimethylallyladenosine synthase
MDDIHKIDIPRVRFTTSHPRDFDDALIEVLSKRGNLMEHIHLPVQSGSTEILKRMSRKYSREDYIKLVAKIKLAIPDVVLTTDIIVGFPGETEDQFTETLTLVNEIGFDFAFTYNYSPRSGTPAAEMEDNVPELVKKARLQRLNNAMNELSKKSNEKLRGQMVEVMVEGESKNNPDVLAGRTRTNKLVHFTGSRDLIGKEVAVRVTEAQTWIIKGEIVNEVARSLV